MTDRKPKRLPRPKFIRFLPENAKGFAVARCICLPRGGPTNKYLFRAVFKFREDAVEFAKTDQYLRVVPIRYSASRIGD